ncbi:MAG: rhodanese-like domain-containing protein [Proteobacteria bacterium]|nr:rhodanese-like domain-containing protein [Pseudomonadota bacterium]
MTETITREQIKYKLDNLEPMTIIEALPAKYFDAEHLPGALNIPHDEMHNQAPKKLSDKDAFIVVYCASPECQNSEIAANTLQQMGYTNTFEYVEGKQHWLEAKFPIESMGVNL